MPGLFSTVTLGNVTLRNRIGMSPMCMYSCLQEDGMATDWHLVHYGSRAVGGAALIMTEEAAVEPIGRITPRNLGIWDDAHIPGLKRVVDFIHAEGAAAGIQLGHAGRKARDLGQPVAPSPLSFSKDYETPRELTTEEVERLPEIYAQAARRALRAGFDVIEIHAAHGYLLNEFLSPLTNHRSDAYGGSFENRTRLPVEVVKAVRQAIGPEVPLFVRLSCSEYEEGGHHIEESLKVAELLVEAGATLIDCSSGGVTPFTPEKYPGYQLEFARRIRHEVGVPTAAVGFITEPEFAEAIIQLEYADVVLLGRELLRNPYWPLEAARRLGIEPAYPRQYKRARERKVW
mgnify:CR=1 FL=1